MSRFELISKYIFFLLLILGNIFPNNLYSQTITSVKNSAKSSYQNIGEILFISNVNGVIENCGCGNPPLGGMAQIATILKQHTTQNKYAYFFDGGDFLNTYPYPLLNSEMIDIYKYLNPTCMALGDQEWIDNSEIDQRLFSELKIKIIATNYNIENQEFKRNTRIKMSDGSKAGVLAFLDENSFYVSVDKKNIHFDNDDFKNIYTKISSGSDLIILMFHGTKYILDMIKNDYPQIDLILWAHEQSEVEDIQQHPAVVGGGSDGEHVKQINILKDGNAYQFNVTSIPVSEKIDKDSKVDKLVEKFKIADEDEKGGD